MSRIPFRNLLNVVAAIGSFIAAYFVTMTDLPSLSIVFVVAGVGTIICCIVEEVNT